MAGILIRNYPTTAATFNSDDYSDVDGATSGTRKMLLSVMATQFGVQLASDGMVFGAGSAAAPKLAVGTAGNGIYASAANTLDVTTNGTRAITVTSGQFVGIGVATPATAFHVGTSLTTSPRGIMSAQYSTGTDGARFHMRKARGTATAPTTVVTGDVLGKLVATGYDGSNYLEMASMSMEATGTVAATRIPTRLVWATATNAAPSVLTDRMWLSASGNLGVGTSSETGLTGSGGLVVASTTLGTSGASGALIVGGSGAFGKKCFITDGSTGAQLRLEYTAASVYSDIGVLSTGHLLVTTTGGNRITSTTTNDTSVLARQVQGGLAFDGVTAGLGVKLNPNATVGTSDFTLFERFLVPSTAPSSSTGLFFSSSALTPYTSANSFDVFYTSANAILIMLFDAGAGTYIQWTSSSLLAEYGGRIVDLSVTRSGTTLTVYLNGIAISGTTVSVGGGTWAASVSATYMQIGRITDTYLCNSTIFECKFFNRALSASEVITLANQGVSEADKSGNLTGQTSGTLTRGKRYRITTYVAGDSFTNVGAGSNATGIEFVATGTTPTTWTNASTLNQIGSILDADLSAGVGYQVPDRSSNKYHGVVSATGTSWTLAQRMGQVRATTNTSGNQQIFSQVSLPTNAIITSIVGYTTGTPTIKIGNVSAGSQLVASVAMSASTYQSFTLAATTSTTGNVWINSSTADTINWTITYMIADS